MKLLLDQILATMNGKNVLKIRDELGEFCRFSRLYSAN